MKAAVESYNAFRPLDHTKIISLMSEHVDDRTLRLEKRRKHRTHWSAQSDILPDTFQTIQCEIIISYVYILLNNHNSFALDL